MKFARIILLGVAVLAIGCNELDACFLRGMFQRVHARRAARWSHVQAAPQACASAAVPAVTQQVVWQDDSSQPTEAGTTLVQPAFYMSPPVPRSPQRVYRYECSGGTCLLIPD